MGTMANSPLLTQQRHPNGTCQMNEPKKSGRDWGILRASQHSEPAAESAAHNKSLPRRWYQDRLSWRAAAFKMGHCAGGGGRRAKSNASSHSRSGLRSPQRAAVMAADVAHGDEFGALSPRTSHCLRSYGPWRADFPPVSGRGQLRRRPGARKRSGFSVCRVGVTLRTRRTLRWHRYDSEVCH
jgi:hypothetical protein